MVSVSKYAEIVEMYKYCPIKVTKDKNKSNEIHYQMMSKRGSAVEKSQNKKSRDPYLALMLSLL